MAEAERRKTTTVQRVSLALDVSTIIAIITLCFWMGRQSQRLDEVAVRQEKDSGATTQAASAVNSAVARIDVIENKGEATQALVRDLKGDLNERLRRIEDKVDATNRRR